MADVRMPDGTIIRNVPDGITKQQLLAKVNGQQNLQTQNQQVPAMGQMPAQTPDIRELTRANFSSLTNPLGTLEALGSIASGAIAEPISGLAGLASLPFGTDTAVRNIESVRNALTFQPRTQEGQERLASAGERLEPVNEALQSLRTSAGDIGYDIAGPTGGAIGTAVPDALMLATGTRAGQSAIKSGVRKAIKSPVESFLKARQLGYVVPPSLAKRSGTQQVMEGLSGPVPTKQIASLRNQEVTNNLIKEDIGFPKDAPLSPEGLSDLRSQLGQVYEQVRGRGEIQTDKSFKDEIDSIVKTKGAFSEEFPGLVKKDIKKFTEQFKNEEYSADAIVDAIRQLRADANVGFRSTDPSVRSMANAQRQVSHSLESLLERRIENPELVNNLRQARTTIAKTYDIEKALKGDNVDAVALGRMLDRGKPFTGLTRSVAEFGQNFKPAAQVAPPQTTNFRPMDFVSGIAPAVATGNTAFLAAAGIRPALRKLILSKPYQGLVANMNPRDWESVLMLPPKQQLAAMEVLLSQSRDNDQDNLQQ